MKYILGIDTSCYTTSMAGVDLNGNIIFSFQKQLDVPLGERGLKQSTALFHHLNNLPILTNTLRSLHPAMRLQLSAQVTVHVL